MSETFEQITHYPTLSDTQRIQARRNAERNVVDKYARKPSRESFADYTITTVPAWFSRLVAIALVFVAIAAGMISAFRLYYAGYDQFYMSVPNRSLAVIVGILTPMAAEVLVIVAAVAMQVYMHQQKTARWAAAVPVALGTVVAFVGNWQITNPASTWGWVETVFPPLAVLSVAFFFEITLVPELERRQANELAYRAARDEYDRLVSDPTKNDHWRDTYGWALWEMWVNVFGKQFDITQVERRSRELIALREMNADNFFSGKIAEISEISSKRTQAGQVSQQDVIDFLKTTPEAENWRGVDIAAETGASQATVSRALRRHERNGHGR